MKAARRVDRGRSCARQRGNIDAHMSPVAVTGAASGIGAAVRRRLEDAGGTVIGVDVRDAEVVADLATAAGRAEAVAGVRARAGNRLDGLVACAGLGPHVAD